MLTDTLHKLVAVIAIMQRAKEYATAQCFCIERCVCFAIRILQVSGHRFWGLLRELTVGGELLRGPWFVHNYCPLVFLLPSGANLTPNKLPLEARQHLQA